MLANHTGIASMFKRTADQYDRLRKRNAFLDMYKREALFSGDLSELYVLTLCAHDADRQR